MNLYSKVYLVKDTNNEVRAIDGSLKNLLRTIKSNFTASRANLDRTSILAALKTADHVDYNLKKGEGVLTIECHQLTKFKFISLTRLGI